VTHRGGGRNYLAMKNDIIRFLKHETAPDVFFTTMIDLYALPADCPGANEAERLRHLPYDRVRKLEEFFAADIDDPHGRPTRLIPHIQLHEFEAVLLCRPEAFFPFFGECRRQIAELKADIGDTPPELVDDGQQSAPSKRISRVFSDYAGAKATAGPQIAEEIGIRLVRERCPHFDAWLRRLESLSNPCDL
jgi:hypothetical protein